MGKLHFATEQQCAPSKSVCSWASIIEGIRKYAGTQSPWQAAELNAWADLLEGVSRLGKD